MKNLVDSKIGSLNSTLEGFSTLFLNRVSASVIGFVCLLASFLFFELIFPAVTLGKTASHASASGFTLQAPVTTTTASLFTEKVVTTDQVVNFPTQQIYDQSLPDGETKVVQVGKNGSKTLETTVTYHAESIYAKETHVTNSVPPTPEIVAVAPPKFTLETTSGSLTYSRKLTVWATSYDPNCPGCNETTATGMKAGYGVIAVDPKVIPLGSKVYVPGYGVAVAGDTGGSIKGNRIDLGFDNVANGNWSSRYTDIYILTS